MLLQEVQKLFLQYIYVTKSVQNTDPCNESIQQNVEEKIIFQNKELVTSLDQFGEVNNLQKNLKNKTLNIKRDNVR